MNRPLTALFAAFEAALVWGVGICIPLAPLTVMWGVQFGFAGDWLAFWRASADIWLVGHGVDVVLALDPAVARSLGVAEADASFPVTIAALGFALLTFLLGSRAGRRVSETRFRLLGEFAAIGTFGALTVLTALSAGHPLARPSIEQGVVLPTLVFAAGVVLGSIRTARADGDDSGSSIRDWINDWRPIVRAAVGIALRGGAMAAATIVAVSALTVAILIAVNYATIISLFEGVHSGILGGFALTGAQLAIIPNLIIWASSWFVGPGFAIGAGSAVSPLGTALGPLPAVPVLGALPTGSLDYGFVGLLVPVIAGFLAGALLSAPLIRDAPGTRNLILVGLGMGATSGVALGLLAWFSGGAAGPGRLQTVGPDPVAVALFAALEVGLAASAGLLAASRMPRPATAA